MRHTDGYPLNLGEGVGDVEVVDGEHAVEGLNEESDLPRPAALASSCIITVEVCAETYEDVGRQEDGKACIVRRIRSLECGSALQHQISSDAGRLRTVQNLRSGPARPIPSLPVADVVVGAMGSSRRVSP